MDTFRIGIVSLCCLVLFSCAQIQPLSGGPKDETPARFVNSKVEPANGSVNFNSEKITLAFDEFIVLNKPNENIIVTPTLKGKPKYKAVNKKVVIDLSEVELEPNTTYSFNFNGAIKDFNEGNDSLYQYVFSTGTFIDSLTLSGKIVDGFNNNPVSKINVLLYENYSDSAVFNERPKYFTQSLGDGSFTFNYLKPGTYKVLALKDEDKNLMYNPFSEEEIGFMKELVVLESSGNIEKEIRLFKESNSETKLDEASFSEPGKLTLKWSSKSTEPLVSGLNDSLVYDKSLSSELEDVYWSKSNEIDKIKFVIVDSEQLDTLSKFKKEDKKFELKYETNGNDVVAPFDTIFVSGSVLINQFDASKMSLLEDTIPISNLNYEIKDGQLDLFNDWKPATDYKLILNEGFAKTIYDSIIAQDTIKFTTRRLEHYGNLKLKLDLPFEGFVEILNSSNEVIAFFDNQKEINMNNLEPGNYSARFIIDENNNGIWDSGNILEEKQPENVIYFNEDITIRSNWDIELEWIYEKK